MKQCNSGSETQMPRVLYYVDFRMVYFSGVGGWMSVLPTGIYIHHWCAGYLQRSELGNESPGTGVGGHSEPQSGCRGWSPCPLHKQELHLTTGLPTPSYADLACGL